MKNFEQWVFNQTDRTEADGCAILQSMCRPGNHWECSQYFDEAEKQDRPWLKPAYWIFEAVKGVNRMASEYYRQLERQTLITGLQIDEMIKDLGGNEDTDDNMLGWVSAAFTMVGSGIGKVPGLVSQ